MGRLTLAGLGAMVLSLVIIIVLYGIIPVIGFQVDSAVTMPDDAYATGTLTLTGNVTTGEWINITAGGATYAFYINMTGTVAPGGWNVVEVTHGYNTSLLAVTNISTAINNNATLAALITATNGTNTTIVTADAAGETANTYGTTETITNGAWGAALMSGGVTGTQWSAGTNANMPTGYNFWITISGFVTLSCLILFVGGFITVLKGIRED